MKKGISMKVRFEKYFKSERSLLGIGVKAFIALLFVFSVVFFFWSTMKYNKILEEKEEKEAYVAELREKVDELEYLVDMPIDDEYKIRIARERLGMCFPDEMMYYTDVE